MAMTKSIEPKTIGGSLPRIDGPLKVSGHAVYTSDIHLPGMLHAIPVCSTIASGKVVSIDATKAKTMPGVKAVFYRGNLGPFYRTDPALRPSARLEEKRAPLEDDVISYYGQYIGVVVADTMEQAQAAADALIVSYAKTEHNVDDTLSDEVKVAVDSERGSAQAAFESAPVSIDYTYATPAETHNPIELHATVATWAGDNVTLYETSQGVVNHRNVLCQILGVPRENVRVVSHFLGSGFGGKLFPWTHSALAAGASRQLGRPVKLVLSRQSMFQTVGHRARTRQRMRLGATTDGKLVSLQHDFVCHTAMLDDFKEDCGEPTPFMYSVPNLRVTSGLHKRNVGSTTTMRGPGAVPGLFAIESAMDELAIKLSIDPVELRLKNEPTNDEGRGIPFSSRHLPECLRVGAEKFGWSSRNPRVGSMRRDGLTLGWGMAACAWGAERFNAEASVELRTDGTARVAIATQDIGTGMYTVLAIVTAETLGIPVDRIEVRLGDTILPPGPLSGASRATASVIPAVLEAARQAVDAMLTCAASQAQTLFNGARKEDLTFEHGSIAVKGAGGRQVPFEEVLRLANLRVVSGGGKSPATPGVRTRAGYSLHSFGAHFCEITWQAEIARLRVTRFVTVIDGGRIINPKTGRNQIEGSVVMGIGMALFEETKYDPRFGSPLNSNLADYMLATNADSPAIDVTFLEHPDTEVNELGARGIGEIGLAGAASAITAATHHATGVRIRELPVRIEDLLPKQNVRTI
jgi:xanthine dehydrogenase YagR molybdenum-binding subunit